jgi:hypothetical protein
MASIEGSLTADQVADHDGATFMLGIFRTRVTDGGATVSNEIAEPSEIEPGHPSWFTAPRYAKAAGLAFVEQHEDVLGFDVTRVFNGGHYRTVHTFWRGEDES